MSPNVRALHVPGARALDVIRERAQTAVDGWARQWASGAQSGHSFEVTAGSEIDLRADQPEYAAAHGCIWFRRSVADRLSFGSCVVGNELMPRLPAADDWAAAAVDKAWHALTYELCVALIGPSAADTSEPSAIRLPKELLAFGSGAVQLSCERLGLFAIADRTVWRSVPPPERTARPQAALTPVDRASLRARVRLDVVLGEVDVELPRVLDLRCGDVLRLPQRLDQPLTVLCADKPVARAALGEAAGGRKGIQLITGQP